MSDTLFQADDFNVEPYVNGDQFPVVIICGPDGKAHRMPAWEALAFAHNIRRAVTKSAELLIIQANQEVPHGR